VFMGVRWAESNFSRSSLTLSQSLNPGAARLKELDGAIRAIQDKKKRRPAGTTEIPHSRYEDDFLQSTKKITKVTQERRLNTVPSDCVPIVLLKAVGFVP
jgi:hypothetical protein